MNFLKTAFKGGLGAAIATLLYGCIMGLIVFGFIPVIPILVNSIVIGVVFGAVFGLAHLKREPTLNSSIITAAGFMVAVTILAIVAGTFAGFSLGSIISLIIASCLLGGGAYTGSRIKLK